MSERKQKYKMMFGVKIPIQKRDKPLHRLPENTDEMVRMDDPDIPPVLFVEGI